MKAFRLITELHKVLNMIKGFELGMSTSNTEQCVVEYKGNIYKLTFEDLGEVGDNEDRLFQETRKL